MGSLWYCLGSVDLLSVAFCSYSTHKETLCRQNVRALALVFRSALAPTLTSHHRRVTSRHVTSCVSTSAVCTCLVEAKHHDLPHTSPTYILPKTSTYVLYLTYCTSPVDLLEAGINQRYQCLCPAGTCRQMYNRICSSTIAFLGACHDARAPQREAFRPPMHCPNHCDIHIASSLHSSSN
jgi:hypothetical protein